MYSHAVVVEVSPLETNQLKNFTYIKGTNKMVITYSKIDKNEGIIEFNNETAKFVRYDNLFVIFSGRREIYNAIKQLMGKMMENEDLKVQKILYNYEKAKSGYPSSDIINYDFYENESVYEAVVGKNEYELYFPDNGIFSFTVTEEYNEIAQIIYDIILYYKK